jgi:toxin ParE1/3/4
MGYDINHSDQAIIDIRNIFQYSLETYGEIVGRRYVSLFNAKIEQLIQMPGIGHHRKDIPANMRSLNVEQHCIIYEVNETKRQVFIVRVFHARMNFGELF